MIKRNMLNYVVVKLALPILCFDVELYIRNMELIRIKLIYCGRLVPIKISKLIIV